MLTLTVDHDNDLTLIQKKIQDVMGPLGAAWGSLELYRSGKSTNLEGNALTDQLQKSIILLGHAMQKVSWFRRLHVLSAVGKVKDVKETLKLEKNQKIFEENISGELFSQAFDDEAKQQKGAKSNIIELFKTEKKKESSPVALRRRS